MLNSAENDPDPVFLTPERTILYGLRDGALNQAIFDKYPETLLFLDANTIFVTGRGMMVIQVVSLLTEQVSSICTLQNENATRTSIPNDHCCLTLKGIGYLLGHILKLGSLLSIQHPQQQQPE